MASPKPNTSLSLSFSNDDDNNNNNVTVVPAADPVVADTTGNNNMNGTSLAANTAEEININISIPIESSVPPMTASAEAFYPPPAQGPQEFEDDEEFTIIYSPTTGLVHKYVTPRPPVVTPAPSSSTISSPTMVKPAPTGGIVAPAPESPQRVVPVSQPMNLLVPIVDIHVCQVCTKRYTSKKALFGHMRSHPDRTWRGANPPPQFEPTNQSANPLWVVVNNSAGEPEMFDLNMVGEDDDDDDDEEEEEEIGTPPAQCGIVRGFDLNKSPPKDDGADGGAGMAIPVVGAEMVGLVA